MFAFESEAFWLNVTHAVLGLAVIAVVIAVVWSVVQEVVFSRNGRHRRA
jgi:hypothetical protein